MLNATVSRLRKSELFSLSIESQRRITSYCNKRIDSFKSLGYSVRARLKFTTPLTMIEIISCRLIYYDEVRQENPNFRTHNFLFINSK